MIQLDVLIQGFPGRAICHGGLGWSTLSLLRGHGRTLLLDVGAFGVRRPLLRQLQARGVDPGQVTDVVLTHAHYDHAVNFMLFPNARVWIGAAELEWAAAQPPGFDPLPELYVRELASSPRVHRLADREQPMPGLTAIGSPGHTPGHLIFLLESDGQRVLFTGDAAKNRAELLSRDVDLTEDREQSRRTIDLIWSIWRAQADTLLIPGHDLCMRLDGAGHIVYQGERDAGINAWFSEDIHQMTTFPLGTGAEWGQGYREQNA